jgi:hypothetical protein
VVYVGLVASLVTFVGMLLVGLPLITLLNRYAIAKWWLVTLAGILVPALLFGYDSLYRAIYFGSFGGGIALVAWMIAFVGLRDEETHG